MFNWIKSFSPADMNSKYWYKTTTKNQKFSFYIATNPKKKLRIKSHAFSSINVPVFLSSRTTFMRIFHSSVLCCCIHIQIYVVCMCFYLSSLLFSFCESFRLPCSGLNLLLIDRNKFNWCKNVSKKNSKKWFSSWGIRAHWYEQLTASETNLFAHKFPFKNNIQQTSDFTSTYTNQNQI